MKEKEVVTTIPVTVLRQTEAGLQQLSHDSGLTIGEVIDRLTLKISPDNREIAVQFAAEQIIIAFSGLPESEYKRAFCDLLVYLASAIHPNQELIQELLELADAEREKAAVKMENLTEEEHAALLVELEEYMKERKELLERSQGNGK